MIVLAHVGLPGLPQYVVPCLASKYDHLFREIVTAGWANESDGNVEAPTGHFARFSFTENERAGIIDMLSHHDGNRHGEPAEIFKDIVPGHYLIQEDSNGLVFVYRVFVESILVEAYRNLESEYHTWDDQTPDPDHAWHHGQSDA